MFILTYCIVYTLFAGLFTKLISIFVLIFMLLSLSAFVRFLLKKLLACLLGIIQGEYVEGECPDARHFMHEMAAVVLDRDVCGLSTCPVADRRVGLPGY